MRVRFGHDVPTDVLRFCCDAMREQWDEHHRASLSFWRGEEASVVLDGGDWPNYRISFCPFCGEKIELEEVKVFDE